MDRRRFTPSAEGLDARVLLSGAKVPTSIPTATLQQKSLRIERLPNYLDSLQMGRFIPADTVSALQADLKSIVGKLHDPPSTTLVAANMQYRSTLTNASIRPEDAAGLRATFVQVLTAAGTPPDSVGRLAADMDRLIKVDSVSQTPAILAANDYALILQTALGVGRPIRTPAAPTLVGTNGKAVKGAHTTTSTTPSFTGSYDAGTTVHLIDDNGTVLGSTVVPSNGTYTVTVGTPLSLGNHNVRVLAFDSNNDYSQPSKPLLVTIKAPPTPRHVKAASTPQGPLSF